MPDVTALFYIAIMAFYLLHKNEEDKILVPIIGFAVIPLFSNDYWLWFKVSVGLGIYVLMVEKAKAGYTGGGAVSAFAMFFMVAFLVSIFIKTIFSVAINFSF
ncbi:hypothetical protein P20652_0021 [Pseudoalteromonas sp. BSi20652]|uniref:hypothetical protein n=2 Tax=Pseudoalteromonas TaxID=53246 RepID=UPI0002318B4D|nr:MULTISPECIES: hypothetical protein [Pseudoalteromonas]MBH0045050.1 hypothetical protein [Pseudoalteromonas sp. NZS11_1]MBZ2194148.1 hypothetical protein [Pseudoalteromonas arctica]PLT24452.1 hypothetical protein CXF89_15570 [Pseudoalteromonas sp. MelDa3]GAA58170.1 hypothetical protein P20652_0021 [Pseudoalteromonas sp. BSi20652]